MDREHRQLLWYVQRGYERASVQLPTNVWRYVICRTQGAYYERSARHLEPMGNDRTRIDR